MRSLICIAVLSLGTTSAVCAQGGDRASTFEFGGGLAEMDGVQLSASGGSNLDVDSDLGYSFRGSYNFTNRFALGGEATWSYPRYLATRVLEGGGTDIIRANLGVTTLHVKGTFYFLETPLTPFFEVGLGWSRVDSNIIKGPPTSGCWWDPWWGQICAPYYRTYVETRTSYSSGFGLRWDMTPQLHLRTSWERFEVDTKRTTENAGLDVIRLGVGWAF